MWSDRRGQPLQSGFQVEQQQARNSQRCGNPEVSVTDQCSNQKGRQPRHLRSDTGHRGRSELVPVRKHQKSGDDQEADRQGQQLRAGEQGKGIADQSDQRKRPHSAERVTACRLVLLSFQPQQERQKKHQNNLHCLRR